MTNTLYDLVGEWTVDGYAEMKGSMVTMSGTCTTTLDGDDVNTEFDLMMHMGENDVPSHASVSRKNFDEITQSFDLFTNYPPFGEFEGKGKILPDCQILWDFNANMELSRHQVGWSVGENEMKFVVTTFDGTGAFESASFMHLTRS